VGYAATENSDSSLAETFSNGTWSAPSSQQPPTPSGGSGGGLSGISCTSSSSCVAVGSYRNASGDYVPLAETYVALAAPVVAPPEAPVLSSLNPSSGTSQGGTLVTLTGENLLGTAFVRFGTTQARSFSVVSPTEIKAMSPPGVGSVPVTVITPGGTSNALSFTYSATTALDLTPTRICDTRPDNPSGLSGTALSQCEGKAPGPGQTLTISIPGILSDPSVLLSVTVIDPSSSGYVSLSAAGLTDKASQREISVEQGVTQSTTVLVETSSSGQVSITNDTSSVLNFAVDLEATGNLPLVAMTPTRICDTRPDNLSRLSGTALSQCEDKAPPGGHSLVIQAEGLGGLPTSGVAAVLVQVTDIDPSSNGYLSLFAPGQAMPTVSKVTNVEGAISSNVVLVPLSPTGQLAVYSSGGDPNLLIDLEGYVPEVPSSDTSYLQALPGPQDICNTLSGNPSQLSGTALSQCEGNPPGQGKTLDLSVSPALPPQGVSGVFVAVTTQDASQQTFLTAWNGLGTAPVASFANPAPGMTQTHTALVGLQVPSHTFGIYNYLGSVQFHIDVLGWLVSAGD